MTKFVTSNVRYFQKQKLTTMCKCEDNGKKSIRETVTKKTKKSAGLGMSQFLNEINMSV